MLEFIEFVQARKIMYGVELVAIPSISSNDSLHAVLNTSELNA